jgi:hypothetical protein
LVIGVLGLIGAFIVLLFLHSFFGYSLEGVSSTEVAIQMHAGQPFRVVGPGNYTDLQPFASLQKIKVSALPFTVEDPEVLTKDSQRIGVVVSGTVQRPDLTQSDKLMVNWGQYSTFYTNDEALVGHSAGSDATKDPARDGLIQQLARQATKVCVGDLDFANAVVGTARDTLKTCIDTELNNLAVGYTMQIANVVVPNVVLSKAVQDSLDAITNSRFQKQVADQNALTAAATADANLATAAGAIRVEAGKIQEQAKQDATTATLNQQALLAQNAVIAQQKANDLFSAQQDVEIQKQVAAAAQQKSLATQADTAVLAKIYQDNPAYANQQAVLAQASAFKLTDKVIIPAGTNPNIIIGDGTQPVVQTPTKAP